MNRTDQLFFLQLCSWEWGEILHVKLFCNYFGPFTLQRNTFKFCSKTYPRLCNWTLSAPMMGKKWRKDRTASSFYCLAQNRNPVKKVILFFFSFSFLIISMYILHYPLPTFDLLSKAVVAIKVGSMLWWSCLAGAWTSWPSEGLLPTLAILWFCFLLLDKTGT